MDKYNPDNFTVTWGEIEVTSYTFEDYPKPTKVKSCQYNDCGWCYAPLSCKTNEVNGECYDPQNCEENK